TRQIAGARRNIDEALDFLAILKGKIKHQIRMQSRDRADHLAAITRSRFVGEGELECALGQGSVAHAAEQSVKSGSHQRLLFLASLAKKVFPAGGVRLQGNELEDGGAERTANRGRIASAITPVSFRHHFRIAEFSQ